MEIEKSISFFIENQFPAIYREDGPELVAFVTEYYKWMETNENQSIYNARRLYEYRDIDTTLQRMLLFFKNKFLSELPFDEENVRFIVKNILALYRRRGTTQGLKLFFQIFFQSEADVYFPARDVFKASASDWRVNSYVSLFPNSGRFYSAALDQTFTYRDLNGKTVSGSISKASGIVDKINIITLNNTPTPVIYLNKMKGEFIGFDEILAKIDGELVNFGTVFGSLRSIDLQRNFGTTGNAIGDVLTVRSSQGVSGEVIVTEISETFTGQIEYTIEDGGFGYTTENTKLLVSNQNIKYSGNTQNSDFIPLERVQDQDGNQAIVIGFDENFVGFKLSANSEFTSNSTITTLDRAVNITASAADIVVGGITPKNGSSPGDLYPDIGGSNSVKLNTIENAFTVSLITDVISNFANVSLDSSNYNDPPALVPMSGNTYGPELVTNGTFDANTDWTLDSAFVISGGVLSGLALPADENIFDLATQPISLEAGKAYQINFDVLSDINLQSSDLSVRVVTDEGTISVENTSADPGSYSGVFVSDTTGANLTIQAVFEVPEGGDEIIIDNASVRQIGVTIGSKLEDAFDLTPFEIGTIGEFININPGTDYINDVFAIAHDPVITPFDRFPQIITLDEINASVSVGDIVSQNGTEGKITGISGKTLFVLPYTYYGFNEDSPLTYKNTEFAITAIETDYNANRFGFNADINAETIFATGRILAVEVINSGFAYSDGETVELIDSNGNVAARGTANARGVGITEGYWSSLVSHLNGYTKTIAADGEDQYFNADKYIHDNDFYQEYSYQIISEVNRADYQELLEELVHVAGTKYFDLFRIQDLKDTSRIAQFELKR